MPGPWYNRDDGGELLRHQLADGSGYSIWRWRGLFGNRSRKLIGHTLRTADRKWTAVDERGKVRGTFRTHHEAAGELLRVQTQERGIWRAIG
ncbi:MAG TPA: hypothetical protein VIK32_13570 [Candidatus Limnocylindrales bacterium]